MNTTTKKIEDGTPVLRIGQTDATAYPVRAGEGPHECLVGTFVCFATTYDRVAPADEVRHLIREHKAAEAGVEVRRFVEGTYAWQRKLWLARVNGQYVGEYRTKADALAAVAVACAVQCWHIMNKG